MPVVFTAGNASTYPAPSTALRVIIGDFDNDGDIDFFGQLVGSDPYVFYSNNGNGTFTAVAQGSSPFAGLVFPNTNLSDNWRVGDMDHDGDVDIVILQGTGSGNPDTYYRNDAGDMNVASSTGFPQGTTTNVRLTNADFNGDGAMDFLYQPGGAASTWNYALNNGNGTFTIMAQSASPFAGVTLQTGSFSSYAADYDGDGDIDLWQAINTSSAGYFRNDAGTFVTADDSTFPDMAVNLRAAPADYDGDGDADILYQSGGAGSAWFFARSNGDGTFTHLAQANSPFAGLSLPDFTTINYRAHDFNDDGRMDLWVVSGSVAQIFYSGGAPPLLLSSTPADNATGVSTTANIVLTFDQTVALGTGNVRIVRNSDDAVVETITVASGQITGSGATWTINPSITLVGGVAYSVQIDATVFVDTTGGAFAGIFDETTLNFTAAASNTAPTFTNLSGDTPAFTEDAGAVRLDVTGNATVADTEQLNFNTGVLTVAITAGGTAAEDVLSVANIGTGVGQIGVSGSDISYQNVVIGTFTGGTSGASLVITLDGDATVAATQALVRALTYNNTNGAAPSTASRTVTITLTDGAGGTSATQTVTVGVTAVNDASVANDDAVSTAENATLSGNVTANNGGGVDSDVDSTVTVTAVNGVGGSVGSQIALASGALLTLNSNGTFSYNPNGRFNSLAAAGSGASNTSATDSFTYTVTGGDTATVTVTVNGVDSAGDILQGTPGGDTIDGGAGGDILNGGDGDDNLSGGGGGDILNGENQDDTLNGGDGGDKLYGLAGIDTLNGDTGNDLLFGGASGDFLNGGAGNDTLDGGTGGDVMAGGADNDVYLVDDSNDQTIEAAGEGYDIVRTELTWTLADNIECLQLQGSGNANGTGNSGANNLQGNTGDNFLLGLGGVDTINGGDGNDTIIGGEGNDLLRGGLGEDSFRVAHAFGTVLETDIVYDFSAAEGDIVDLSQIDAVAGGADNAFTLVASFTKAAGQMTLTIEGGNTVLRLDITGDGKTDYQMKINGDVTGESGDWAL